MGIMPNTTQYSISYNVYKQWLHTHWLTCIENVRNKKYKNKIKQPSQFDSYFVNILLVSIIKHQMCQYLTIQNASHLSICILI